MTAKRANEQLENNTITSRSARLLMQRAFLISGLIFFKVFNILV
jgi:hypothetical protein